MGRPQGGLKGAVAPVRAHRAADGRTPFRNCGRAVNLRVGQIRGGGTVGERVISGGSEAHPGDGASFKMSDTMPLSRAIAGRPIEKLRGAAKESPTPQDLIWHCVLGAGFEVDGRWQDGASWSSVDTLGCCSECLWSVCLQALGQLQARPWSVHISPPEPDHALIAGARGPISRARTKADAIRDSLDHAPWEKKSTQAIIPRVG